MSLKPPDPRARALDLAIPVASCVAAGIGTAHLLAALSREELAALVDVLALAVSSDPVRLRAVVAAGDGITPAMISREAVLRKGHAEAVRLRKAGQPVPLKLRLLDSEYGRDRKGTQVRRLEPCGTLAAYRRHKDRGEDTEGCGCADAAREGWKVKARKRAEAEGQTRAA